VSKDGGGSVESVGPLDEIRFWSGRCDDLAGLDSQLDKPGVRKITNLLTLTNSSYIAPFMKLCEQVKVRSPHKSNYIILYLCYRISSLFIRFLSFFLS